MFKRCLAYSGIILLNLTGLGLGFLALRRWSRWREHILITVSVFLLAVIVKAYQAPLVWAAVAGAWVLVMVVEAFLILRSAASQPAGWLVFVLGVAACALTAGGIVWYEQAAVDDYSAGVQAYQSGNCQEAMRYFDNFNGIYRFSLTPMGDAAAVRKTQCSLYLYAVQAGANGFDTHALQTLDYLASSPDWELPLEVIQTQEMNVRQLAALKSAARGAYQDGIRQLLTPGKVALTAGQQGSLREQAAQMTLAWGDQVYSAGDSQQAISIFKQVMDDYGDTQQAVPARQHLFSAYQALAEADFQKGDLVGALSIYRLLQNQYPAAPEAQPPAGRMIELYQRLAASSYAQRDYPNTVSYDEALLSLESGTAAEQGLHLKLADIYLEWAADLHQQGQFEQALGIYEKLAADFSDSPAAAQAAAQIPYLRLAWVDDLYVNNQFDLALEKLGQMSVDYASLPFLAHVNEKYPEVYLAWGQNLFSQGKFAEAIQKYQLVKNYSKNASVLARAQKGIEQAQSALGQ